ncbi:MAG TPA: alpha/beta hydrolase [Kouleothrix sp.]|uniref:alpha/beta fold hydrolase n=1 Tax=Kouleothrix sp. TaxID=2779161 RepID=UPI002BE50FA3|nr:alpha/beta hydrolase [Kouleothrix sp.]HRC74855.1 alpha/beta hydrolase [Kouleothrix sp.]
MYHPQDFEHHYVSVNRIRMHYAAAGHGPELLVMLHGFPECWWSWRHQLALFRDTPELAARYTAVAPDLRGYNETDRPTWGYELDVLVQDVVELIRALGHRRATIVGHDWGGNIAWSLAIARPELVVRLAALNIPHPALFARAITSNWRQLLRSWYILFFQLPLLPELAIRANGYEFIERVFVDTAVDKSRFTTEDIRIFKSAMAAPGAATAAVNYYRALVRVGARGLFRGTGMRVHAPTLMLWGEQDIALGKELTYGTEEFVPDLRIRYMPNSSHWVQQDQPELVNEYLRAFLAEA